MTKTDMGTSIRLRLTAAMCLLFFLAAFAHGQSADFNGDGILNCLDVDSLTAAVASGGGDPLFDLDANGVVDRADLTEWLTVAGTANVGAPYIYGDGNLDGSADTSDYGGIWDAGRYTTGSGFCGGDYNADGVNDNSDGLIIKTNIGQQSSPAIGVGEGETLIPSDVARLIYDSATGNMFIATESKITGLVIPGPEASDNHSFPTPGNVFANGVAWSGPWYVFGKQQWQGWEINQDSLVGMQGNHLLATYDAGLSQADFGVVEYGANRLVEDLEGVLSTQVCVETVLAGDANLDGVVDASDFNVWNENKFTSGATWGDGDFNNDGMVDGSDFNLWNSNKFTSAGWDNGAVVVPEPGGLTTLWLAVGFIFRWKRRFNRR